MGFLTLPKKKVKVGLGFLRSKLKKLKKSLKNQKIFLKSKMPQNQKLHQKPPKTIIFPKISDQTPSLQIKDERISLAASLLLCFFFLFDFGLPTQFNRFIVILLTGLLVGRYSETCTFLTNKFAVLLGDASYSTYLIHWPLFTWHRYANGDQYASEEEADFLSELKDFNWRLGCC